MAERRMFAKTIIDSDAFLDMPATSQLLYFHLCMRADDDGFINSPRKVQRIVGCSDDDLRLLIMKRFLIPFESGVVVIKHWKIHNYIRQDRYKETVYQEEKALLIEKENKAYTLDGQPSGNRLTYQRETQVSLGKERKEEEKHSRRFTPPSVEEVRAYCKERNNDIDPAEFVDFYTAKGWKVGNQPMKDWKAAVRTWEKRREPKFSAKEMEVEELDINEIRRGLGLPEVEENGI